MQPFITIMSTLLGITAVAIAYTSFSFQNLCPFPVYVKQAVAWGPSSRPEDMCADFGETTEKMLPAGGTVLSEVPMRQDTCGHSVKVARWPRGPVYQYEFCHALENGNIWYNLSGIDGNPFTDVSRQLSPNDPGCPRLRCEAGNNGQACDYPVQTDCQRDGHLAGYLCLDQRDTSVDSLNEEQLDELRRTATRFEDLKEVNY